MSGALDGAALPVRALLMAGLPLTWPAGPAFRFFAPPPAGVLSPNVAPPVPINRRRLAIGKRVLHVEQTGIGLQKTVRKCN